MFLEKVWWSVCLAEKVCHLFYEVSYIQKHTFLPGQANNRTHTLCFTKVQSAAM